MSRICSFQNSVHIHLPFFLKAFIQKNPWVFCSLLPPPQKNNEKLLPSTFQNELPGHQCSADLHHIFAPLAGLTAESEARNCQFFPNFWPEKSLDISHCKLKMKPFKKESHLTKASYFEILWFVVNWGCRKQHGIYFHQRSFQACSILGGV